MPAFHDISQGSLLWLSFRKDKISATNMAAIMGVSIYQSPFMLWQEKLNLIDPQPENEAMKRGKELEPIALDDYNIGGEFDYKPVVVTHTEYPDFMASIDGFDKVANRGVEIKCMGTKNHAKALDGHIDPTHYIQIQWQMFCTGCQDWDYFCFDGKEGFTQTILRDPLLIAEMLVKAQAFLECLRTITPPSYTDLDYDDKSTDPSWQWLEDEYAHYAQMERINEELKDSTKKKMVELAAGRNVKGARSKLTAYQMQGKVDYSAIPELKNINLDTYRKPSIQCHKITIQKEQ